MRTLPGLAFAALLAIASSAAAHTAIYSGDGMVRGSIGLLNEPTVTYQQTGLDACFTENVTVSPRPAVPVNPGALTATLHAPDGSTLTLGLVAQFGRTGCVTFDDPLVLTLPGQYTVDIQGTVNGSAIQATGVNAGGAVHDQSDLTFPQVGVDGLADQQADLAALAQQVAALQQALTTLQADLQAMEDAKAQDDGRFAPGAPVAWLVVGLAVLVAARRGR